MAANGTPRDVIFDALLKLLLTASLPDSLKFRMNGRRLFHWDKVPAASQPAIFLSQGPQTTDQEGAGVGWGMPKWTFHAAAWIYFRADATQDQATYPDQIVNAYLDAIEAVLVPVVGSPGYQTLYSTSPDGRTNLVSHCWIQGPVVYDSGNDPRDPQGVIVVPITLVTGV